MEVDWIVKPMGASGKDNRLVENSDFGRMTLAPRQTVKWVTRRLVGARATLSVRGPESLP